MVVFSYQEDHYKLKTNSIEVNGLVLLRLLQAGGNHEIWHKDTFRGGEYKFIASHANIDVRTI